MEFKQIKNATLEGTVSIPPSKSVTHRLLMINALSQKSATLVHPLVSEDTMITAEGLRKLGYQIEAEDRLLTKEEAYTQISHSASLFKAILEFVKKELTTD